jgi:hypothetical protein
MGIDPRFHTAADRDAHGDVHARTSHTYAGTGRAAYAHADRDFGAHADAGPPADGHAHADRDLGAHPDADRYTDGYRDTYAHGYIDGDRYGHGNTDRHANTCRCPSDGDAHAHPHDGAPSRDPAGYAPTCTVRGARVRAGRYRDHD